MAACWCAEWKMCRWFKQKAKGPPVRTWEQCLVCGKTRKHRSSPAATPDLATSVRQANQGRERVDGPETKTLT